MATLATPASAPSTAMTQTRWIQLVCCIICMMLIANLQYGWTFFVDPMNKAHPDWSKASIQFAFAIFIALETWLTPIEGWIVDNLGVRLGPKLVVAIGGILVAVGWFVNSRAETREMLYLGAVLSGIGGGGIYATCVGQAVKWFPDRRGLAVGLTAAGYGAGAALTVIPIRSMIAASGYQSTFLLFGLLQGGIAFLLAWVLRAPDPGEVVASGSSKVTQSTRSYSPWEVLTTPVFWLLYIMFVVVAAPGLVMTAQVATIAGDFSVANAVLFASVTTLSLTGIVDNICNGGARPLFGWVSDQIGREYTMVIAFGICGIVFLLFGNIAHTPWAFAVLAPLVFLTWGEIFSLFPSTSTDTFGSKFATVNLSLLYTAKGTAGFLVPVATVIKQNMGSWNAVFIACAIMNFVVVALALFALKPLRARFMAKG
jgi:OFA family oxalate/formate antiporter-like MFS transporter